MPSGRPVKEGLDFFPLDVHLDEKFDLLESEHGIVGFGTVIKLLQKIYNEGYFIYYNKKLIYSVSKWINVDINTIDDVINSAVEWEIFDEDMFFKYGVLTSRGIQKRYFQICFKRKEVKGFKEILLVDPMEFKNIKIISGVINPINDVRKKQSESERKVKGKKEIPKKEIFDPVKDSEIFLMNLPDDIQKKWTQEQIESKVDDMVNYQAKFPKRYSKYSDYYAVLRSWLKKDSEQKKQSANDGSVAAKRRIEETNKLIEGRG